MHLGGREEWERLRKVAHKNTRGRGGKRFANHTKHKETCAYSTGSGLSEHRATDRAICCPAPVNTPHRPDFVPSGLWAIAEWLLCHCFLWGVRVAMRFHSILLFVVACLLSLSIAQNPTGRFGHSAIVNGDGTNSVLCRRQLTCKETW